MVQKYYLLLSTIIIHIIIIHIIIIYYYLYLLWFTIDTAIGGPFLHPYQAIIIIIMFPWRS